MHTRKKQPTLLLAMLFILSGLACNAAANLNTPLPPTEFPLTHTPLPPSPTTIPFTATSTPIINCTEVLSNVLHSMNPDGKNTEELRGRPTGEEENDFYTLSTYQVNNEKITWVNNEAVPNELVKFQEQLDVHQKIWDYYVQLIPKEQISMLGEFVIITDGKDNLLAAVRQTNADLRRWVLVVDIADIANSRELTYTLIHEFGHLVTLNSKQVTPSTAVFENPGNQQVYIHEELRCDQYFPSEGCSRADSYLNSFYEKFWADIYDEWKEARLPHDDKEYYKNLNEFYLKYQDRFVTDYAAVKPVEDIAESFSFFILSPIPAGDTIAEKKILFFHEYPELVKLRSEIQNRICSLNP